MKHLKLLLLLFVVQLQAQQGGMWIPSLLQGMNEKEMKNLGMKMTAADIYSVNKSSLFRNNIVDMFFNHLFLFV